MGFTQIGQFLAGAGRCLDGQHGQGRRGLAGERHAVLFFDHNQYEPRTQLVIHSLAERGEQPWKIWPVEFNGRKQIGFEIAGQRTRFSAHHLLRVNARHVRRPVQLCCNADIGRTAIVIDPQVDRQFDHSVLISAQGVRITNVRRRTLAYPGQEMQDRRLCSHGFLP